jgi:hypothetical protein
MFIKEIKKKNSYSDKVFTYHRLIESYRTPKGPRHRTILNLGTLTIDKSEWKLLANRIEEIVYEQESLFDTTPHIEQLAQHYASLISHRQVERKGEGVEREAEDFRRVDINSVRTMQVRTIGAEHIAHSYFQRIEIPKVLASLGFSEDEINIVELLVAGRLISPGSENHTLRWAQEITGLGELMNTSFKNLPKNRLYRCLDRVFEFKDRIEEELKIRQEDIFNLKEKIILFDLTNTYFEGKKYDKKIAYGRSKEKRSDCPLISIGLLIDEKGFLKSSRFFEGNISEPKTLQTVLNSLSSKNKPTIIMDAGIATEDNLKLLRSKGFDYICVSRSKPKFEFDKETPLIMLGVNSDNQVEARKMIDNNEVILFCKSNRKAEKEQSMLQRFKQKYEEGLEHIKEALTKKGGTKKYAKVLERIGRLKEQSHGVHRLYNIHIEHDAKGIVTKINYEFLEKENILEQYKGQYYLRSSRIDLDEKQLWELYLTLNGIEDSFRTLKDELNIRPIYHRKQNRIEAHLFITLLAYQVLNAVRHNLNEKGLFMRWKTLRETMSTHVISTVKLKEDNNKSILIRTCSEPEFHHKDIYQALSVSSNPIPHRKAHL